MNRPARTARVERVTSETDITVDLLIDGRGQSQIATKIPFFDHMLTLFARHGLVDLNVRADGDIEVDLHHTVEDTGIGIAADRLQDVFAPFVQVDRRLNAPHEGTGLGLAISRDIVRAHGGDIHLQSAPGAGSTFTVWLPAATS